jgi:isopropylmalate/homocitrate/citramalate synthase
LVFELEDRVRIARALDDLGVDRIEAGMPVVSQGDREGLAAIADAGLNAEIWGFGRCLPYDVEVNAECGVHHMTLEIASSELKMDAYGMSREKVIRRMLTAMERARELDISFAFMPVDLTRADMSFAEEVLRAAVEDGGADEIVVVDSIGVASPDAIGYLTRQIGRWVDVPLSVHCHNDFGLGVANTLAGLKNGARCAHVGLNLLGERAGNVDLAELVMSLRLLYGQHLRIHTEKLAPTARMMEEISGYEMPPNKAIVGKRVFARESGGVVQQLLRSPEAVEPYDPTLVGLERSVVLGKKSGRYSVEHARRRLGLELVDDKVDAVLEQVKELSRERKDLISDDDFRAIVTSVQGE